MGKCVLTQEAFAEFMQQRIPRLLRCDANWPDLCCTFTTEEILGDLRKEFEGDFSLVLGDFSGEWHQWIEERSSRMIVDPTVGQFIPGIFPCQIFRPTDPEYRKFTGSYYKNA